MSLTVTMPQLGETVTEGTILRWAKQPGDTVTEDEVLLEISTDKVDTEVPAPASGTLLEILVPEGETVEVGTRLAVIGEASDRPAVAPTGPAEEPAAAPTEEPVAARTEEAVAAPSAASQVPVPSEPQPVPVPPVPEPAQPAAAQPAPDRPAVPQPAEQESTADLGLLSPVVRKLAAEHDVDLSLVGGTGRGGRITRKDIQDYIDRRVVGEPEPAAPAAVEPAPAVAPEPAVEPAPAAAPQPAREPAAAPSVTPLRPPDEPAAPVPAPAAEPAAPVPAPATEPAAPVREPAAAVAPAAEGDSVVDLERLRVRIAENMIRSKQTAAHVWTVVEVDFEAVEQVRRRYKEAFKEREGFSLTYMPFISRAVIDALQEYPIVNSSFLLEEQQRIDHAHVHLGIAVDMNQQGLIVMRIPKADGLRMRQLAREIRTVAEKARAGRIEPDDITGSTFTVTNPGPYGSLMSAPIINIPNVAILSTDTVTKRPVVVTDSAGNDAIAIRHIGYLGLTWDHRAFDGSTAVLFLRRIKDNLESWDWEHELS
jgi:2-oxoglutarate dehydrogenase E2 component (dihydrolipoamide succinyltransferase)